MGEPNYQDTSYYPMLIKYLDRKYPEVVRKPEELEPGHGFKVLELNFQS